MEAPPPALLDDHALRVSSAHDQSLLEADHAEYVVAARLPRDLGHGYAGGDASRVDRDAEHAC